MQPSPYTPGEVAREVPGRGEQLAQVDERLAYLVDLQRLVGRIRVDLGSRGLGKTSLLREVQRRAQARGAVTVWVTAGERLGLVAAIAEEIHRTTQDWRSGARGRLRELVEHLKLTVGVPGVATVQASLGHEQQPQAARGVREFEDVVRETVAAAHRQGHRGLVLFIDEIQASDPDGLRTLAYAWQHLQSEGADLPAAVFAAGLPGAPEAIAAVVTFSERFAYRPLAPLTDAAAELALVTPARVAGVEWERPAVAAAVRLAQGYPYSVQLIGDATWSAAGFPDAGARLTLAQVRQGEQAMRADLEALFRARWERSTPREQDVMHAMAGLGDGPVRRAEVARVMGLSTSELSVARARLIDKGLVDVAGHGQLAFTIPGFAEYVRTRTDPARPPASG
ncbi:MAG TPA: ATP-binding protein [Solirubrobacteraceae bacterium]|nr:ATP-binding protein [Solirubrobacteraceae bacterium]